MRIANLEIIMLMELGMGWCLISEGRAVRLDDRLALGEVERSK